MAIENPEKIYFIPKTFKWLLNWDSNILNMTQGHYSTLNIDLGVFFNVENWEQKLWNLYLGSFFNSLNFNYCLISDEMHPLKNDLVENWPQSQVPE